MRGHKRLDFRAVALTEMDGRGIIVSPKSQIQIDKCVSGSMVEHATLETEAVMLHIMLLIPPHREAISKGHTQMEFRCLYHMA